MGRINAKPLSQFNLPGMDASKPDVENEYLSEEEVASRKAQVAALERSNFIRSIWLGLFKLSAGALTFLCIGFTVNWGIKNFSVGSKFMYLYEYSTVGSSALGGLLMLAYLVAYALPTFIALYFVYVIYRETSIMAVRSKPCKPNT